MELARAIEIAAEPAVVWSVWTDLEHWPRWTPSVARIERLTPIAPGDSKGIAVGLRVRIHQPRFPAAVWRVAEVNDGRSFVWVSTSIGARITAHHRIEALATGSRVSMGLAFEGAIARLIGWLSRDLTLRYLQYEAEGLKARCEALARTGA
jgi:hypothetical protein